MKNIVFEPDGFADAFSMAPGRHVQRRATKMFDQDNNDHRAKRFNQSAMHDFRDIDPPAAVSGDQGISPRIAAGVGQDCYNIGR